MLRALLLIGAVVVAAAPAVANNDDAVLGLRMRAEPLKITQGETVRLEVILTVRGQDSVDEFEAPDLTDFVVLNESEAQQASFFARGGRRQVVVEHKRTYLLRADDAGALVIGEATAVLGDNSARAAPIKIAVRPRAGKAANDGDDSGDDNGDDNGNDDAAGAKSAANEEASDGAPVVEPGARFKGRDLPPLFLEVVVDKASPYVGEQVTVVVELWSTQPLGSVPRVPGLKPKGFTCLSVDDGTRLQGRMQQLRGRAYYVYPLTRDALFAHQAGRFDLGGVTIEVNQGGSFFRAGKEVKLTSPPTALTIRPLPAVDVDAAPVVRDAVEAGVAAANVGTFRLAVTARPPTTKVGEPFTLVIEASGYGNIDALTLPTYAGDANTRLFPPTLKRERRDRDGVVAGRVVSEILVQPQDKADVVIPPLTLVSFSPSDGRYQTSTAPGFTVRVQGQKAAASTSTAKKSNLVAGPRGVAFDVDVRAASVGDEFVVAGAGALVVGGLVGALTGLRRRRRATAAHLVAETRAARARALRASPDLAAAQAHLFDALAERAGPAVRATPLADLAATLVAAGLPPPLAARAVAALSACEAARYAPGGSGGRVHADVVAVVDDVHAVGGAP